MQMTPAIKNIQGTSGHEIMKTQMMAVCDFHFLSVVKYMTVLWYAYSDPVGQGHCPKVAHAEAFTAVSIIPKLFLRVIDMHTQRKMKQIC